MNKIRKGDQVIVIAGRDKGKRGVVLSRVSEERILVEGVNVVKKHVKPNPMLGIPGGVVEKVVSIHQSNVAIFNEATGKADRVGIKVESKILANGKTKAVRLRVFKSSGEEIKVA